MEGSGWLWIALSVWAAFAQTLRNTAQRSLTASLGTLGATLVRFLYGLPFALAWLAAVHYWRAEPLPAASWAFLGWVTLGAVAQIAATAFLLLAMEARSFALGVAYSKTEILQIAVFGLTTRPALLGLASGAGFAFAAVGYRGAALSLDGSFLMSAATALAAAQFIQTVLLGGWLLWRSPDVVAGTLRLWRPSLFAGFMGAAASAGWFSAFALQPAAHVRTVGLIELVFSYAVSLKLFREKLSRLDLAGMVFLALGIAVITLAG